eukprot:IDg12952t1
MPSSRPGRQAGRQAGGRRDRSACGVGCGGVAGASATSWALGGRRPSLPPTIRITTVACFTCIGTRFRVIRGSCCGKVLCGEADSVECEQDASIRFHSTLGGATTHKAWSSMRSASQCVVRNSEAQQGVVTNGGSTKLTNAAYLFDSRLVTGREEKGKEESVATSAAEPIRRSCLPASASPLPAACSGAPRGGRRLLRALALAHARAHRGRVAAACSRALAVRVRYRDAAR